MYLAGTSPEDMKQAQVRCVGCHFTMSQKETQQNSAFTQNGQFTQGIKEGELSAKLPHTTFVQVKNDLY